MLLARAYRSLNDDVQISGGWVGQSENGTLDDLFHFNIALLQQMINCYLISASLLMKSVYTDSAQLG